MLLANTALTVPNTAYSAQVSALTFTLDIHIASIDLPYVLTFSAI